MAYDEETAARMRRALAGAPGTSEKRMMGGVCFFLNGNMLGGADRAKDGTRRLMFRIGKANADKAAELGALAPLQLGDRLMPGFYFVESEHCDDEILGRWLELALSHAGSLPTK